MLIISFLILKTDGLLVNRILLFNYCKSFPLFQAEILHKNKNFFLSIFELFVALCYILINLFLTIFPGKG